LSVSIHSTSYTGITLLLYILYDSPGNPGVISSPAKSPSVAGVPNGVSIFLT